MSIITISIAMAKIEN